MSVCNYDYIVLSKQIIMHHKYKYVMFFFETEKIGNRSGQGKMKNNSKVYNGR